MRKFILVAVTVFGLVAACTAPGDEPSAAERFAGLRVDDDGCPGTWGCPKAYEPPADATPVADIGCPDPVACDPPGTKDPWPTPPDTAHDSPQGLLYCAKYPAAPYCAVWALASDPYEQVRLEMDAGVYYVGLSKRELPEHLGPEYQDPNAAAEQLADARVLFDHAASLLPEP